MSLVIKLKKHFKHVCFTRLQANAREREVNDSYGPTAHTVYRIKYTLQIICFTFIS